MDIRTLVTVTKIKRVLWFVIRNPFLILKRGLRWSLTLLFWLFVLGWGISAFAAEFVTAPTVYKGNCQFSTTLFGTGWTPSQCTTHFKNWLQAQKPANTISFVQNWAASGTGSSSYNWTFKSCPASGACPQYGLYLYTQGGPTPSCPPDGKPEFSIGPVDRNGVKVCEKPPITCKMGEIKAISPVNGSEVCNENCASVAGQGMTEAAYNQAFLPSATVTCYGSCSVISQGTTVELPLSGFTMVGDIQFTGDKCPVTFPETGDGQPVYNDQPESSDETTAAQDQLQNAASNATSTDNAISGATGTADLNQVVDKLAETSNAEIKAMSEQNAALGKVIEGVGKDIQGAIKQSGSGGGGASVGQMQTANAIKEGNATLKEIADKLDEQQDPEPPVKPSTELDPDPTAIHEANDWGQRNFGTVLTANAERFRQLPIFSLPTTFFTANIGGSSCPTYSGSFSLLGSTTDVRFDAFCSPAVMDVMPFIRAVVMMFFGWLAWRIAIGNGG